ncbi:sulfate transporter subunit; periplasmic-binding component of ABC superfamily [Nitrospira japonica]|uniref:Sulfate transporter subunit periplasmic-binding component of ABC superfamily n=1 Tax=Nitrospira japonica TaxID=1325564 RepID=A0A1W1I7L2_9BACT|nr:sulfate ABC transporter substrate-binding protein [Nitrospira japonica]SLM48990.1 sulfate transporter subunit; periplasmic-binding component of ABC superfamily [Nitrospira japonica]
MNECFRHSWSAGVLVIWTILAVCSIGHSTNAMADSQELLNVSYDVSREFYKAYNAAFARHWLEKTGRSAVLRQSHGGSTAQARAVLAGLEADVVTMNQESDIAILAEQGGPIAKNWRERLPNHSVPFTSTIVFLVRSGNPKRLHDWPDLIRPGVAVIMPNPKTSGNGRYSYLAAWGQLVKQTGSHDKARQFVHDLLQHVPVFASGGRGATTTFLQRDIGDVLLTFEHEVSLIQKEAGTGRFEIVYPTVSILAESPVAVVDRVADKHGTRVLAEAYLDYLYSEEGQELAARHHYRPSSAAVMRKHASQFPALNVFSADDVFGGWQNAIATHFSSGGVFDQMYQPTAAPSDGHREQSR